MIALRTAAAVGSSAAVTSLDLTWPSVAANDVAVLAVAIGGLSAITEPGAPWTAQDAQDATGLRGKLWTRVCTGSESGTFTLSWADAYTAALGWAFYRGVDPTTPVNASANQHNVTFNNSSSTSRSTSSLTAVNFNAKELHVVADTNTAGTQSWALIASTTERFDVSGTASPYISLALGDKELAARETPFGATHTSTRSGTAFIGWHLILNQAMPTAGTTTSTINADTLDILAAVPTSAASLGPSPVTSGQIWPRGA